MTQPSIALYHALDHHMQKAGHPDWQLTDFCQPEKLDQLFHDLDNPIKIHFKAEEFTVIMHQTCADGLEITVA